jgi:thioredoxin reductase (NADPH)
MEKVIILGSGIAGLTAAIYTARASLEPLIIAGPEEGGQLTLTTDVENFPGFPQGVQGPELIRITREQATKFGTKFATGWVNSITAIEGGYELKTDKETYQTKTIIVTTGASARWLGCTGEDTYKGRGVTTCATCDGFFYKGKEVIVVGGGDSACEESIFLTKFATKVTMIIRRDQMRASKIMADRAINHEKIDVIWNSAVEEVVGDGKKVTGVKLKNTQSGELTDFKTDGVFLAIGHIPNTSFLKGLVDLDDHGFIKTDRYTCTNAPGIFAGGDVQDPKYKQAITAAGTGCQAALESEHYLTNNE